MTNKKNKIALAVICLIVGILHIMFFSMSGYLMTYGMMYDESETENYNGFEVWDTSGGSLFDDFSEAAAFSDQEDVFFPFLYTFSAVILKVAFAFAIIVLLFGVLFIVKTYLKSEAFDNVVKDSLVHKLGLIFIRLYFWLNCAALINFAFFGLINIKTISFYYTTTFGLFPSVTAFLILALGIAGSSVYKSNYRKIYFPSVVNPQVDPQQPQSVPYQASAQAPYQAPVQEPVQAPTQTPAQEPVQEPVQTKFCTNCGTQLPANAKFCNKCGTAV